MKYKFLVFILGLLFFTACSTTKNIPEGDYLLNTVNIKNDTKNTTSDLMGFVRQKPNGSLPVFGKFRLKLYNMAGEDTTKWRNRTIKKLGAPPVLYNERQTGMTLSQLRKELNNQGYLDAEVDTLVQRRGKKLTITYEVKGGKPYRIRNYAYNIEDTTMARIMSKVPLKPLLSQGDMFDMSMLEQERAQVNTIMRNVGYFNFSKEFVYFKADTTLNSHQVDLFLNIYPARDSLPYNRYKINSVTIVSGYGGTDMSGRGSDEARYYFKNADTTDYKDIRIIRGRSKFLTNPAIYRNNSLHKGAYFSDRAMTNTYEAYSKIGAIKQVNMKMEPVRNDSSRLLDATVILVPANPHSVRAALEGTNSAGDIGVAPSITYRHQNLFNGGEQFSVRLRGAYEFIASGKNADLINQNFYEIGVETSLTYPLFLFPFMKQSWRELPSATTRFSLGFNNQHRPEYTRQFFNGTVNYGWNSNRNRMRHSLDFLDINYVLMPWISDRFQEDFLDNPNNVLLQASYKDQLIARSGYAVTIVNSRSFSPLHPTYVVRLNAEIAGVLPRLVTALGGSTISEDGHKQVLGVAYAEYIKGGAEYARTFRFTKQHSLAYRVGLGLASPYGNSSVLPFERRYFSGGANSVRGWNTRRLGPGAYQTTNNESDFVNQAGDIKLDLNIEDRHKISELFELAGFIDAGNIWTLRNYENQKEGQFRFAKFYKEIAVAYGFGLRLDLDFLLLRLDTGIRAYDPGLPPSQRFVLFQPRFSRMAVHFGIGYPF